MDDGRMHFHAKEVGADSVLIREIDFNYKLEKREYE